MSQARRLSKVENYETRFRCGGSVGILREEVWEDDMGEIAKYNLAFLMPHLFRDDNGRVLGYDNAHGRHERHFMGTVKEIPYEGYEPLSERFYREVSEWRKHHEDKDFS